MPPSPWSLPWSSQPGALSSDTKLLVSLAHGPGAAHSSSADSFGLGRRYRLKSFHTFSPFHTTSTRHVMSHLTDETTGAQRAQPIGDEKVFRKEIP